MFETPYIYIYIYIRVYIHIHLSSMYIYRYGHKLCTDIDIERVRYRYLEKSAKINLDHKPISSLFLVYAKLFALGFKRR